MALGAWALALAFASGGGVYADGHRLAAGHSPAWTPDGRRIAFVQRGDVWIADADGSHRSRLLGDAAEPAWSPDGTRLAFTRGGSVWIVRADRANERRFALGADPAWSPDGRLLAYERDGSIVVRPVDGGPERPAGTGSDPAWLPDARLSWSDSGLVVAGQPVVVGTLPLAAAWSPGGARVAFVDQDQLWTAEPDGTEARLLGPGHQPAWRPPVSRELLPDFDQRPPSGFSIAGGPGRWLLGFTSQVDNVGLGPAQIEGFRAPHARRMDVRQRVKLSGGGSRLYEHAGRLRYTNSAPHFHWHLMRFDTFELRTADGRLLVRDRKSGFCLADHYGTAPGVRRPRPHFLGSCEQGNPGAHVVIQGTSLGYTDRYPAHFHGQNVEITGVPGGTYVLVHRTNPNLLLHELRYENNAASARIRLSWRAGTPAVRVLKSCPASDRC